MLTTFATPFGRCKWNRTPLGVSSPGEIFQQRLYEAVEGLDGVYTIAGDILVTGIGDTMQEAIVDDDRKIKKLLERCRKGSIKLNEGKVPFKQTEVPYIGHLLTSKGVKGDLSRIDAVLVSGVQRFMGTVNYLAKFLPKLSEVSEPLRLLTRRNP